MSTEINKNENLRYKQLQDYSAEIKWEKLVNLIVLAYVDSGIGKLKVPVESMIRIYFLQQRYNLNSVEVNLALSRIDVLQSFARINLATDVLPEEECIHSFSCLIEKTGLFQQFTTEFNIQPMNSVVPMNKAS